MEKQVNIAFVSDDNYSDFMIVAMKSIMSNAISELSISFYILDTGISEKKKRFIHSLFKKSNNITIEFIEVNTEEISKLTLKTHVSASAFAKVYISDLLDVDKIIYLDCDLLVNHDISVLWDEFEDDVMIKAVWNPFYNYDNEYFGIEKEARTFNSGVMLLDLKKMRSENISSKLLNFLHLYNSKTKLHDQAAFNGIFKNDWIELDFKWNYQVSMIQSRYKDLDLNKVNYFELYHDPYIIHFTSNSKPWQSRNAHPYKRMYTKYYQETFHNSINADAGFKSYLKKAKENFRYKKSYLMNYYF